MSQLPAATKEKGLNEDLTRAFQQSTIVKEVEDIVRSLVDAVNVRQLHADNPLFVSIADPKFFAVPYPPVKLDSDQYLAYLRGVTERNPEYRATIRKLDTQVDHTTGIANVLMDFELTGVPAGVRRRSVSLMRFRKGKGGKWHYLEYQATDGIEDGIEEI